MDGSGTRSTLRPLSRRYSVTPSTEVIFLMPCAGAGAWAVAAGRTPGAAGAAAGAAKEGASDARSSAATDATFTNMRRMGSGGSSKRIILADRDLKFRGGGRILAWPDRFSYNYLQFFAHVHHD